MRTKILPKLRAFQRRFSAFEIALWLISTVLAVLTFAVGGAGGALEFVATLIGVTALLLNAKGFAVGQALMIIFCLMYGIISYGSRYYGEMITYLGMSMPMAIVALVTWLKNPYKGRTSEVAVARIGFRQIAVMIALSVAVTVIFYFILKAFNTAHLFFSTLSITTSFAAAYLSALRSPYFAFSYALNDVVLIVLWALASVSDAGRISVVVLFVVFLANDIYGFFNWKRIEKRQYSETKINAEEEQNAIS